MHTNRYHHRGDGAMERVNYFNKDLDTLHSRVHAQVDALEGLQKAFTEQAEYLRRYDQAQCLDELRERVKHEIAHIKYGETVASLAFKNSKIGSGLFSFAAVNLLGLVFPLKEHPLKMGAKLARNEFADTKPFGTVMVSVGANGVPEDVHIFSISEYARKRYISEVEVKSELKERGYRLFTQEAFFEFLERLKHGILQGTSSLPATKASTTIRLVPVKS